MKWPWRTRRAVPPQRPVPQPQAFPQAQPQSAPQAQGVPQPHPQMRPPAQVPAQPQMGMPVAAQPQVQTRAPARITTDPDVWPDLCERFCLQFLVLAEKMRPAMDLLEEQEEDPDRLEALYEIDHGVTRMRRAARDLRVLAGRDAEEASGADTSLLDVVRMAESSIEQYQHVSILRVVELAVPAYAAEDLASLVAALLDNATRYSPSRVTVSAHLLADGAVMLRIEDSGIGMSPSQLDGLNKALAGPVPPMTDETSRQTGFPVVHRLARRHGIGVRLAGRTGGTVAMVTIPPSLLCEIPADEPHTNGTGEMPPGMAHLAMARRVERPGGAAPERPVPEFAGPERAVPAERPAVPAAVRRPAVREAGREPDLGGLPRRERASLRPVAPPAPDTPPAPSAPPASDAADAGSGSSFAADLDAFTAGASLPGPGTAGTDEPSKAPEAAHDLEEGRQ
ncbi:ATP-binding protein [Actinomadura sp. LD22]|uniref:histidine kinase n=1 Tax=Actinomadura physcomitrii TaxID=2650748 RepID=A0A6I4M9E8_9ACTN|nr:HAMP domain-containing sensor histidine kinase [Actinomadura physcomitrii]MWA02818.1 ATP-binding protein [Actinomadura physcomitrii]